MKTFKRIIPLKEFLIKNRKLIMFILIILLIIYVKIFFTTGLYFNETFLKKTVANDVIYYHGSNKQGDISITIKGDVHHDSIAEISYNLSYNNHEEYIVGYIDASSWNAGVNSITNKNGDVLFEGTYLWNRLDFYDKNGNYLLEENKPMPNMVSYNEEGYIIPLVNIAQIAMLKNETIRGNLVILFLAFLFFIKTILDIKHPLFMFKISTWPMVKDPQPSELYLIVQKILWVLFPLIGFILMIIAILNPLH